MPLSETYDIEIKGSNNTGFEKINFDPYFQSYFTDNPCKFNKRIYPFDWGTPYLTRLTINMHLPDNYIIEVMPQKSSFELPDKGGDFLTDYSMEGNNFTFSCVMLINKSSYTADEYPYLKEFFNKIILYEKSNIILKKN